MSVVRRVSIIIPAYEEGDAVTPVLARIAESVTLPFEALVVVDTPDDPTVAAVDAFSGMIPASVFSSTRTDGARRMRFAMGSMPHRARYVVVTMADGCDDPRQIDELARLVERGVVVAAASRYMSGRAAGGRAMLKGLMSKVAGGQLYLFRTGRHPRRDELLQGVLPRISSAWSASTARRGFEIGIELIAKARSARLPVAEIPTIWLDRHVGVSNFKLHAWIPRYLHWYRFAFGRQLDVRASCRRRAEAPDKDGPDMQGARHRFGRLHRRLRRRRSCSTRGYEVVGLDNFSKYGRVASSLRRRTRPTRSSKATHATSSCCTTLLAGLRSLHRRRGDDRRHLVLPRRTPTTCSRRTSASWRRACDAAIAAHRRGPAAEGHLPVSSSMVFESADHWPSRRGR